MSGADKPPHPAALFDIGETAFDHGEPCVISIYNGSDLLGYVGVGRSIRAVTPDGLEIGRYSTKEEARRAVVLAAYGGGLE
jgi:hypothetical protein